MSLERSSGAPIGSEPVPTPTANAAEGTPAAMRLQILSTEHWSLLASRGLAWNETFSRSGMFLTTLSGAMVALALVAQATAFGGQFMIFALVILPVVLFVGITTLLRLGSANYHESMCVVGMNRIRAAYLELAPELEPYFVMGVHDDERGAAITGGIEPDRSMLVYILSATPGLITTLNALLAATIGTLVGLQLGMEIWPALVVGLGGLLAFIAWAGWYARGSMARAAQHIQPMFPTPDEATPGLAAPPA
jgi:hypothetical protein